MNRAFDPYRLVLAFVCLSRTSFVGAETGDAFEFYQDEAKVVTASRHSESAAEAPVMVDVVTAEEIKTSGATNLWDLLRFRVGLNVYDDRSADGNRAIVSVRGFGREFVGDLLVLVDGQSVYTNDVAGTYWEQIPVQMQDIERIEIIRGPSAALYGSNAGLGVINIISRKAQDHQSISLGASAGNMGMLQTEAAVEQAADRSGIRASYTRQSEDGFDRTSGAAGNDFLLSNKANLRGYWNFEGDRTLEYSAGGAWQNAGVAPLPESSIKFDSSMQQLKFTQALPEGSGLDLIANHRDSLIVVNPAFDGQQDTIRDYQYELQAIHHFGWMGDRMQTVWGGSYSRSVSDSVQLFGTDEGAFLDNDLGRGFVNDVWKMTDYLALSGAASVEHSEVDGTQPAYQTALIATPTKNHTFRLTYSMAPTLQSFFAKAADYPVTPNFQFVGNPNIDAEKIHNTEINYEGFFMERRLQTSANLFYMHMTDQRATVTQSTIFLPIFQITKTFDSRNDAIARGAEASLKYKWSLHRWVYANYTFESISDALGDVANTQGTPIHAVNIGGSTDLFRRCTLGTNVGYKDAYVAGTAPTFVAVPAYWRVDARLAYALPWYQDAELYIAGQNLATPNHLESADRLQIARTYWGGATVKFGGHL